MSRPKVDFQPLRDIQLFFRLGYAAKPCCLLGITLSLRLPHSARYAADAPCLTASDIEGFVVYEALAAGLRAQLVETISYSLTFFLFELHPGTGPER